MAARSLHSTCSRKAIATTSSTCSSGQTRVSTWLKPRLASRHARGIVLWHFTGCDLWRAEAQTLREAFGLPVLLLEASEEPGVARRILNRLEAFVETLK